MNEATPIICTFPDYSQVVLDRIIEITPTHTHIVYYDETLRQELWVPHSYVSAQQPPAP
jgi:hypothetical protein